MDKTESDFWVIGVGASAGGLEALSSFFKSLPDNSPAAFIVAQHLAPHAKSMMVELLARQTKMKVIAVKDHLELEAGIVYVVPPNYDVTALDGELRLTKAGEETRPKPSVDTFFQSLAKIYGRRSVGIILSGTGSDGSEGVRAIKESGGAILVQDTDSAKYDGMPKSAYDTGLVDAVLPPEKMAQDLFEILKNHDGYAPESKSLDAPDEKTFNAILKYLKKEVGTDFSQYKSSTIHRRVEKRVQSLGLTNLQEYFAALKNNTEELLALSHGMLVSVTSFFRDPEAFEALMPKLEEMVSRKTSGDEFRIWVAGCATGEEAFSITFLVLELMEKQNKHLVLKVFGSDLDHEALAVARSGRYSDEDAKGIPEKFLTKYLERRDSGYEVKKAVKDLIVFARQDLIQNPPFVKIDLITCRNVLIYFDLNLQNRVFEIFHYALKPSGILFLGKSESVDSKLFETVDRKEKIYRRLNVISPFHGTGKYTVQSPVFSGGVAKRKAALPHVSEIASLELLKMFNISGVVVDEDGAIAHLVGDVSEYISFPTGQADFRLSNLLSKSSSVEFSVLLRKALKEKKLVRSRAYKTEKSKKTYYMSVKQMEFSEESDRPLFLVSFELKKNAPDVPVHHLDDVSVPGRMVELEQEIAQTRENLQTLIEELEISNEELQSLNEELSSTNEELQASNEELETTNEELQIRKKSSSRSTKS